MLKVPYFKQDTDYTCGPATLQMVLAFYGIRISEEKLAKLLETNDDVGTRHNSMIDFSREEGFNVFVNTCSKVEEIRRFINEGKSVIVHFLEPDGNVGHYSVVVGIDDNSIFLNDPWNGENFEMNIPDFEKRWRDDDLDSEKWLMVLSCDDFNLGKQYHPTK
jgi:ABC-type bacteriocin/lantibiotic exporter with double-glycine peptidase domain